MKRFFLRLVIVTLCVSILVSPFSASALSIPLVGASDPVTGAVPTADNAYRSKEVQFKLLGFTAGPFSLDAILYFAVRILIDKMSDSIVKWVNDGYDGGPSFVTDPQSFFFDIADSVGGEFLTSVGGSALCSPFRLQIQGSLKTAINGLQTKSSSGYGKTCKLTTAVGNIQNFLNGDFSQGGWNGWFAMTQDPTGNPYSQFIDTQAELGIRIGGAQELANLEINWADGFLPLRKQSDCIKRDAKGRCIEWKPVKTPGKVIEDSVERGLGTELSQLELADEFDEIIGAVLGRLINDIFGQGLILKNKPGYATGPGTGQPRGGSCYPDQTDIVVGDTVTWTVQAVGTNLSYIWGGTDGLSGTTTSVAITYTSTTTVPKTAWVDVTDTIVDQSTGSTTIVNFPRINCQPNVNVANFPPIGGTCKVVGTYTGQPVASFPAWNFVTYTLTPTGGSGTIAVYKWNGSNPDVRTPAITPPPNPPVPFPQPATYPNGVKYTFFPASIAGPAGKTFQRWYDQGGPQNVDVTLYDADLTLKPGTINCPSVDIFSF